MLSKEKNTLESDSRNIDQMLKWKKEETLSMNICGNLMASLTGEGLMQEQS